MSGSYKDDVISWGYVQATEPFQAYGPGGPQDKKLMIPTGQVFRVYKGGVGYPWQKAGTGSLMKTPTPNGYSAIELPPTQAGQVWAAYKVKDGYVLPPPEVQGMDASAPARRIWVNDSEARVKPATLTEGESEDMVGAFPVGPEGGILGQQGKGKVVWPLPVNYKDVFKNWKPSSGSEQNKLDQKKAEGTAWLLYAMAGGSALVGAPLMVPAGLAALGVWAQQKSKEIV